MNITNYTTPAGYRTPLEIRQIAAARRRVDDAKTRYVAALDRYQDLAAGLRRLEAGTK